MSKPHSWFRMYNEVVNDPKVQKLSGDLVKGWLNLLCIASSNGGELPNSEDVSFTLRTTKAKTETLIETLLKRGLLDDVEGKIMPHNWSDRQYKSDVSTDRVKRFRDRSKSVSETPNETPPEQSRDRTESETERKGPSAHEVSALLSKATERVAGRGPPNLPPEQRKAIWQSTICKEAERTMPNGQYAKWLEAFGNNEPWAKRKAEEINKHLKHTA